MEITLVEPHLSAILHILSRHRGHSVHIGDRKCKIGAGGGR
ncbi:hypothetical protein [Micromonospora sp. NPDC048842]